MNNRNRLILFVLISLVFLTIYIPLTLAKEVTYNPPAAATYAKDHCATEDYNYKEYYCWDPNNPKCVNYGKGGGTDCASFASQVLIKGGLNFGCFLGKGKGEKARADKREFVDGAVIIGKDGKTTGIRLANDLYFALEDSFCFEQVSASEAKPGDIIIYKKGKWVTHVEIVTGDNLSSAHTGDKCDQPLEGTYEILRFQENKCKECKMNEETCKAELKDKCDGCSTCDPSIGTCNSGCRQPAGRCAPGSMCKCFEINGEKQCSCINTGPGGDCPDDTLTVASQPQTGEVMDTDLSSPVGVLNVGYTYDMQKLLSSFGEDVRALLPSEISPSLTQNMPLLIIPTGGLHGMENSTFFKVALDEYVKQGGSILVLTQQHGYEFSVLPVPQEADGTYKTVSGYGWAEDQSCQANSSYIDTWHNVLAGRTKSTPSLNVDGYFTSYPDNTTVLLRRTVNGQPAVILYPYGNGYIIAATIYIDWAYSTGQSSEDERRLIRDIVSWLVKPDSLQEIEPGQDVTVDLSITNNDDTFTTTAMDIWLYDPNKNFIKREKFPLTLAPGASTTIPFTYTVPATGPLGIYHIKYGLYTEDWILWHSEEQPEGVYVWDEINFQHIEEPSGRFIISSPPTSSYEIDGLRISVNTPTETFLSGEDIPITVTLWNYTDTDDRVRLYWEWDHSAGTFLDEVIVPAQRSVSMDYTVSAPSRWRGSNRLWVHVFSEGGLKIPTNMFYNISGESWPYAGSFGKGITSVYPSATVSVSTDKNVYTKGETVNLTLSLQNRVSISYTTTLKVSVSDPRNTIIYDETFDVSLASNGTSTQDISFTLPTTTPIGTYTVRASAYYGDYTISSRSTTFKLPQSQISVSLDMPSALSEGTNTLPFSIINKGDIDVSSGTLDVSLKDPDGVIVYTGDQSFAIGTGETINLNIPVTIPPPKLGRYELTYTQSDETRQGQPTNLYIYNTINIVLTFDKSSYRVRETANLTTTITNTGKFNLEDVSVTVSVPDANYTNTQIVSLLTNSSQQLTYAISIPETMTATLHYVDVTFALPSGSSILQDSGFSILRSSLTIGYSGLTTLTAGDTVNIEVTNAGGVDTTYITEHLSIIDSKGVTIYQNSVTDTILAGEQKILTNIQIPSQTINGTAFLNVQIKDTKTGEKISLNKSFEIIGLTATLQTRTNKDIYLKAEEITGISSITNGQFAIEGGNLRVTVNKKIPAGEFYTLVGEYGSGDGQFNYPHGIAVDDSKIYITDFNNGRVQIFDKTTNKFLGQFGSWGDEDGQFDGAHGITVNESNVYVTDYYINYYKNCIQIFDKNTYTFIGKFGLSGTGDGYFRVPYGIAVDDSKIYITDLYNYRVQIFDKITYAFLGKFGSYGIGDGEFTGPRGIAVDNSKIYVADECRVQIFDKTTYAFLWEFGSCGDEDGQFDGAHGITVNESNIYVADPYNHRIQIFDKTTYAFLSKFGSYGMEDGQFNYPEGIAVASDSSVYIVDTHNHRVQRMASVGSTETLLETTIPITQPANVTQDYIINIDTLNTTGKLYLEGTLSNSLGQTIAFAEYSFYVIDGDFAFIISTDKKIYRLGETVTITGEVKNLSAIQADGVNIEVKDETSGSSLYTDTAGIPAGDSYSFTITTTANTEGVYSLKGTAEQNNSIIAEVLEQYEVSAPEVSVSVSVPAVVGNELFDISMKLKNEGKVDANIQFTVDSSQFTDSQNITIPAEETKLIQYQQQISQDTEYTFTFTGDLEQTITKIVSYGLAASITINPQTTYPEGNIAVPVTITNTGQIDETLEVDFQLSPVSDQQLKTYFIPESESVTDTLYFNLTEGDYQLTASSLLPVASSQANFSVKKDINVDMTVSIGAQSNSLIPVTVNLTNLGYSEFNGGVQLSVVSSQGTAVWNGEQVVSQLSSSNSQLLTFDINSLAIEPANYTVKAELLDNSNNQITQSTKQLTIEGAIFQITQVPTYQTLYPNNEATFTFTVKNTGNQEGAVELSFNAYDLIDSSQTEWLTPKEEKSITFSFMLPDDLEEKDYFADYELKAEGSQQPIAKGQVKYHVSGINLSVSASLDKQNYNEGDTAYLTLQVADNRAQGTDLNLFAKVNYADYNSEQAFTLNGSEIITFDIPLTQITGEKLFYGIYYESGRSIHLNSLYIYEAEDALTIITDKQVYNPSETVIVTLTGNTSGTLTLTAPDYEETFNFTGTATKSFTLSSEMTAGTYFVNAELLTLNSELITLSHPFDVTGISVKVKEATLDKSKYASSDTLNLSLTIESNQDMPATLKTWIIDPEGKYTSAGENNINLSSSENSLIIHNSSLVTAVSGIHRLVYSIYSGDLLLVSGAEAFDVGDAVLLGLSTDKTDYPTDNEPVTAIISAYGTVDASLELQLDDTTIITQAISFTSVVTLNINIGTVEPGTHNLKTILTAGGLKSTKETTFTYAFISNQPPVADTGEDFVIYLGETAILDGSVSYDPDNWPEPLTYLWSFVAVPTDSNITNSDLYGADTVSPSFVPDVVGTYILELMVSDGQDTSFDNVGCSVVYLSPNPDFFLPPVKNNKVFKLGSIIPVKFQLTDANGAYISTATANIVLQQYSVDEPIGDPIDATSTSGADSGNLFRYDSDDDQYIYNLSTKSLSTGTWQIVVELDDGTTESVFIGLK